MVQPKRTSVSVGPCAGSIIQTTASNPLLRTDTRRVRIQSPPSDHTRGSSNPPPDSKAGNENTGEDEEDAEDESEAERMSIGMSDQSDDSSNHSTEDSSSSDEDGKWRGQEEQEQEMNRSNKIPKPRGSPGRVGSGGYNLEKEMSWDNFNEMQVCPGFDFRPRVLLTMVNRYI